MADRPRRCHTVAVNARLSSARLNRYNARPFSKWLILVNQRFVAGQRWLSEAEPDLGLGQVEEADARRVRVRFPAVDEVRNYAAHNAPLMRVRFAPEDQIRDRAGQALTVTAVESRDDLLFYRCDDPAAREILLPEVLLDDRLRLNRPQDKLLSRRIDGDAWFGLRYRSWLQAAARWRSPVIGLQGPRIDPIPHQLYIAAEVTARPSIRVLLADEVGLGKTIEAGLILHRLALTERIGRVLVVVPDALVHQWLVEMLRRFNLTFAVFDASRVEANDGGNPFDSEQRVLCSLSFLTATPEVAGAVLEAEWDLLIVDEAHHLTWSETEASPGYALVEALAAQVPHVLLLTATPEQLGRVGHFGRLRLLDPQRFHDYRAFVAEEAAYGPVARIASKLIEEVALDDSERRQLDVFLGEAAEGGREQIIARLIDRHGTGRVLFRNTRQAIKGFPGRHLNLYPLECPDAYRAVSAEPHPEVQYGAGWQAVDPRVAWLYELLRDLAPAKVLVICAHAGTASGLREHLLERRGLHAAMFHEGMEIVARDRAAAFFADPDEGSQVLICSEIGSEGRNFQFAHHLVLFDLPLEPDLLEQRIGRLDRIGQRRTIELHVPYLRDTASAVLVRWYHEGLASFEASCPAATSVFSQLAAALTGVLSDRARTDRLVHRAATLTRETNAALEAGRDRLLELHSHDPRRAGGLVADLAAADQGDATAAFMAVFWDSFGVEHEPGPGRSLVLRPSGHMLHEHFPGLPDEGATVTFDRADALAHEDRLFLNWEHPMVRGSMEMLTGGELGSAAIIVCRHSGMRTGVVLFETLFVIECMAPRGLAVQRFLPPTCLRLLLDAEGRDRAGEIAHEALGGLCLAQNRKLAETVIKSQAARVKPLLTHAEALAKEMARDVVAQAASVAARELDAERQRLLALAAVNPNVRDDEIEQLSAQRERMLTHLEDAQVRLDAVRIVVMR